MRTPLSITIALLLTSASGVAHAGCEKTQTAKVTESAKTAHA